MSGRSGRRRSLLAVLIALAGLLVVSASASASGTLVYDNVPSPLPGNLASIGYEATSTSEYGGEVSLVGTARKNPKVTVIMSAWGCEEGGVYSGETCQRPKEKKKFKWPLTLNVYSVGAGNTVGTKLATVTHTFGMPYRPSSSKACTEAGDEGAWEDLAQPGAEVIEKCFHGISFPVKFHLSGVTLPSEVIVSVAYNTSAHGEKPVGTQPCDSTAAGCYYDSLNVGITEPSEKALTVGSQPTETQYVNSTWPEMYCGKSESLGTFTGVDCPTWYEGDQPAIQIEAAGK